MVRFKGRYYLVSFELPHDLPLSARAAFAFPTAKEIVHRLKTVIKYHFGQFGLGMVLSNLSAKYYNTATHLFIIKSARTADYIMRYYPHEFIFLPKKKNYLSLFAIIFFLFLFSFLFIYLFI